MLLPWAGLLSCDYLSGEYLNLKKIVTENVSIKYFTNIIAKGKAIQKLPLLNSTESRSQASPLHCIKALVQQAEEQPSIQHNVRKWKI